MRRRGGSLLVVAAPGDGSREALISCWPGQVLLVTPRDLSRPGWQLRVGTPGPQCFRSGRRRVAVERLEAAIVRLGWITPALLDWVREADREYVAAEMTAFLLAFLSNLPCRMLNRPEPACLAGPAWRLSQWRLQAARCGFALADEHQTASWTLDVVGGQCFGARDPVLCIRARQLAAVARCGLLSLTLAGSEAQPRFVGAYPFPDLSAPGRAAAAVDALHEHREAA